MIVKRFVDAFHASGVAGVLGAIARRIRTPRARCFSATREFVSGAIGIEIGRPSLISAGGRMIPVYPLVKRVDSVNFTECTIWEDATDKGDSFKFQPGKALGTRIFAEGGRPPRNAQRDLRRAHF